MYNRQTGLLAAAEALCRREEQSRWPESKQRAFIIYISFNEHQERGIGPESTVPRPKLRRFFEKFSRVSSSMKQASYGQTGSQVMLSRLMSSDETAEEETEGLA